jgi:serine protease AprX
MKKIIGCLVSALVLAQVAGAQTRYIIKFKDKGTSPYSLSNPSAYLSPKSVARRLRYSIGYDSTDLPVTPRYIDSIRLAGQVTILNISKWLNSVSIQSSDPATLAKINSFPFVQSMVSMGSRMMMPFDPPGKLRTETTQGQLDAQGILGTDDYFSYGSAYSQIHIHNGEFLHNIGLRGQQMVMSMIDAGFNNYLTVKAFDSARINGQILGVYDFVAHDSSVNEDNAHGMECFSTIAANIPGQFVGTAPKANYFLFRSEDAATEYPIEEHNWVCAAERADSLGSDIISTSLGYNTFDAPYASASHTYADMNGNITMAAVGADLAAKKGILVVVSAGNNGNDSWHYIATPADADSVLAVGAVSGAGVPASFSSYGPSSDGQVKPDVAAVGVATTVQLPGNVIGTNQGTSFSAPIMAGLTTCLWQGFQEYNNMKIIDALRKAGSIVATPNDRIGYGIPDVRKAVMSLLKEFSTANASLTNCKTTINWMSKDMSAMKYEIERKLPGQPGFTKVGEVSGTGASFAQHSYSYDDVLGNASAGTLTYRIRQVLDTATASFFADYTDTVSVNLTTACTATGVNTVNPAENAVTILPNPARSKFSVKITTTYPVQNLVIRLLDAKGQSVSVWSKAKGTGTTTFEFAASQLASGKYFITISNGDKLIATKELLKL